MSPTNRHADANILPPEVYEKLLKTNLKNISPDEASETWEVLMNMQKERRRKRWIQVATGTAFAVAAGITVGILIYQNLARQEDGD